MIVAKIQVTGAIAHTVHRKVIPAGVIGAQVELEYADDVWSALHKTVVFRGVVTKDVITDANIVTIPPEVAEKPLSPLSVGVYGVDADGNLAIPTIWADIGFVRDSANPSGDTTTDPSLPVWAQIQGMIGNLEELETTARDNLVAAVNEAMKRGGGTVEEGEIRRIVDEYLAANPPDPGEPGKSAYDLAVENGYSGSETDWLASLHGAPGKTPEYGVDYGTQEQIDDIANKAAGILADDFKAISDGKVDKVDGKGLSTNDYDNAAKAKVDAIPEDPKYTDTVYDDTEVKLGINQLKEDLANKYKKPSDGIPESDLSAGVTAKLHHILTLTQAEYDSIAIPDPDTYYCIMEEP